MLANERVAIGAGGGGARRGSGGGIDAMVKLARQRGLIDDPVIRQGLADVYIRQRIMGFIGQRTRAALKSGKAPGPEGSIAKLAGALLVASIVGPRCRHRRRGCAGVAARRSQVAALGGGGAVGAVVAHRRRYGRGAAQHHR